jgi:hypothetical protein
MGAAVLVAGAGLDWARATPPPRATATANESMSLRMLLLTGRTRRRFMDRTAGL